MKKILWASRHELDLVARQELEEMYGSETDCIESREILWPDDSYKCYTLARDLLNEFEILAGVWPGQAVEGFRNVLQLDENSMLVKYKILSPVSIPEKDIDVKKVRPFRFVRWAVLL